jgi:hypothetical protein
MSLRVRSVRSSRGFSRFQLTKSSKERFGDAPTALALILISSTLGFVFQPAKALDGRPAAARMHALRNEKEKRSTQNE